MSPKLLFALCRFGLSKELQWSLGPKAFHHGKKEAENADFSKVLHKVLFLIRKKKQIKKFGESKKKKARRANKK